MSFGLASNETPHKNLIDDELLALTEQLDEASFFLQKDKGKYPAHTQPDNCLACSLFTADIQSQISLLNDAKIALSIAQSVATDSPAIEEILHEEERDRQDRNLALHLNRGGNELDHPPPYSVVAQETDTCGNGEQSKHILTGRDGLLDDPGEEDNGGPSKNYIDRQKESLDALTLEVDCDTCCNKTKRSDMVRLKCNHRYCKACLKQLFMLATKDESRFPPFCCRNPIPLVLVYQDMTAGELDAFKTAEIEFSSTDRLYCSNADCGKFITPDRRKADQADCKHCNISTCVHCKSKTHGGDCKEDQALEATLALAETEGWRRCHSCRAIIELNYGCYHIT